jgi:Domain of unknown function (DUF305)
MGPSLFWLTRPLDSAAAAGRLGRARSPVGLFNLGHRMVRASPAIPVLAADLHAPATLLDRLSGTSVVRRDLSTVRLAPLAHRPCFVTTAVRFARYWAVGAAVSLAALSALGAAQAFSVSLPLISATPDEDRRYIRHMVAHHDQGIELARLAITRAHGSHLRALAALMIASQSGENLIFISWWSGWFDDPMPICSDEELTAMPGI